MNDKKSKIKEEVNERIWEQGEKIWKCRIEWKEIKERIEAIRKTFVSLSLFWKTE